MKRTLFLLSLCLSITTLCTAQEIKIKSKDGAKKSISLSGKADIKPDIYIDGKKYDHEIVELLDTDKIESIEVVKGEKALEKYNAPNGVVLITSKSNSESQSFKVDVGSAGSKIKISGSAKDGTDPMVIIDGKKQTKGTLSELSPDDIESINVFKGEAALEKYNAPNGVIVVITKKGNKN